MFQILLILLDFYEVGNSVQASVKNFSGILEEDLIPLKMKDTIFNENDPVKQLNGMINNKLPSINFQNMNRFEEHGIFEIKR